MSSFVLLLAADRLYGTSALIELCQSFGWQYRIRLKGNLVLQHEGGELQTSDLVSLGFNAIQDAELNESEVRTCIGVLVERGYEKPWIIAMDCKPSEGRVPDYGMRWGIEALFSDFKTRGFSITKTQLKDPKRIERSGAPAVLFFQRGDVKSLMHRRFFSICVSSTSGEA